MKQLLGFSYLRTASPPLIVPHPHSENVEERKRREEMWREEKERKSPP